MELIQTTNLHYHDFRSDKVYYAELCKIPKSNLWNINFAYGRRGNTLVHGTKNEQPLPYNKALSVYNKLVNSKITKGYNYTASSWVAHNRTRAYVEANPDVSLKVIIAKELNEGNTQCATVDYKKSTTEKLGLYKFVGWAAC